MLHLPVLTVLGDRCYFGCCYEVSSFCAVFFYHHDYITTNHVHFCVVQQLGSNRGLAGIFDTLLSAMIYTKMCFTRVTPGTTH